MSQDFNNHSEDAERVKNFLRATYERNIEEVKKMLDEGVPVDVSNSAGLQGIHFASKAGNLEMMILLLDAGASVDAQSLKGNSPLHAAALTGESEVVKLLLNRGANTNTTCECNENVFTPLYMAAQIGHLEIVTLLLAHGADPLSKTSNGFTARDIANQQGHRIIAELLDEYTSRLQGEKDPGLPPHGDPNRPRRERLDSSRTRISKRLEMEVIARRAPAISKRDIFPSPRNSPMRCNALRK